MHSRMILSSSSDQIGFDHFEQYILIRSSSITTKSTIPFSMECTTPNITRFGGTSFMDPKYIPGVKSEGIPLQPQPSTSISTSAVSTAAYRDFFVPSAGTAVYQHPMHSFFSGKLEKSCACLLDQNFYVTTRTLGEFLRCHEV
ncbi:unnamed protein product [Cercopithifilaria johnstoni]|uniref:Uncharacterized protein n=1 Tax=Cercopithifilaria johnstoni TaxID=2874296 RepID=A0A8J2PR94_9BILA|nr:unnamed protein product [Cercopithifilaria johnstoni]